MFGQHHSAFAVRSGLKVECSAGITGNLPGCLCTRATISFSVFLSVFRDGVVLFASLSVIYYNLNQYYFILCMEKVVIEWRWKVSVNQLIIFSCLLFSDVYLFSKLSVRRAEFVFNVSCHEIICWSLIQHCWVLGEHRWVYKCKCVPGIRQHGSSVCRNAGDTLHYCPFVHEPSFVCQEERPFGNTWHTIKPQHEDSMNTNIQNSFNFSSCKHAMPLILVTWIQIAYIILLIEFTKSLKVFYFSNIIKLSMVVWIREEYYFKCTVI